MKRDLVLRADDDPFTAFIKVATLLEPDEFHNLIRQPATKATQEQRRKD